MITIDDIEKLSPFAKERLVNIYSGVRDYVMADELVCNNWVKKQFFEDSSSGYLLFVENFANALSNGEIDWYSEDKDLVDHCFRELKVADFVYKP